MIRCFSTWQSQQIKRFLDNNSLLSLPAVIYCLVAKFVLFDIKISFRQRSSSCKLLYFSIDRHIDLISSIRQKLYCYILCHIAAIKALSGILYHILHLCIFIGRPEFHISTGHAISSAHLIAIFLINDRAMLLHRLNLFIMPDRF